MRVVLDTNVVVAGLVAQGLCHELIEVHLPLHEAILSEVLWGELSTVPREKFDLEPGELPFLDLYRRHATWVEAPDLERQVSRDLEDDRVLAAALAGEAAVIVTGDEDLLSLGEFEGIEILTPRGFLEHVLGGP